MTAPEPLRCPRCRQQAAVVEQVLGRLDWGPAVLDADGAIRPEVRPEQVPAVTADNSTSTGVYGHCDNKACQYEWKLRRRFDSAPESKEACRG